jgi:succinyl-CoA synthetase beta subunit
VEPSVADKWKIALADGGVLDEHQSLQLLRDFRIPAVATQLANNTAQVMRAAQTLGFPVALKTAKPGEHHKTDVDGVRLNLADEQALQIAYAELASRLGPRALVAPMAPAGVELALGMFTDATVGPVVVLGPGGTLVEYFDERLFAIPPFGTAKAKELLARLRFSRVVAGARGRDAVDLDGLAETVAAFSVLCATLSEQIAEIDVNPLLASSSGTVAVDGLIVGHATQVVGGDSRYSAMSESTTAEHNPTTP